MTAEELAFIIRSAVQGDGYGRKKTHLYKMKKFSGGIEGYPIWRQDLLMCLDREGFTSEKDKAIFTYKNLEGEAEQRISHLLRPLSDESFTAMIAVLDLLYGTESDLDRLLVKRIAQLPKLEVFTRENLGNMIITLNGAFPALWRRNPEALRSTNSDMLVRVLNLLPHVDKTMFLFACHSRGKPANLQELSVYLENHMAVLKETERPTERLRKGIPQVSKPAAAKQRTVYVAQAHPEVDFPDMDASDFDDDDWEETYKLYLASQSARREQPKSALPTANKASPSPMTSRVKEKEREAPAKRTQECILCRESHHVTSCDQFLEMTPEERQIKMSTLRACYGCLVPGHSIKECKRRKRCPEPKCKRSHHPMLHDDAMEEAIVKALYDGLLPGEELLTDEEDDDLLFD